MSSSCRRILQLSAIVALGLSAGGVQAGSVFMKNGYIIQGPITERSEDSVVLGWPNGKVTIHKRFIESVSYDAGEEKRLQDEESHRAREGVSQDEDTLLLVASNDADDLPLRPEDLLPKPPDKVDGASGQDPGNPGPSSGDSSPNGSTPTVDGTGGGPQGQGTPSGTPGVISRPDERLADRLTDTNLSISLRPPKGWTVKSSHGAFRVFGEPAADGFRPSMNVVSLPKGPLGISEYVSALKENGERTLQGFEVLSEGPREIGQEKGYELSAVGSYKGHSAAVRQVLVVKGDRVWLVSAFSQEKGNEAFMLLDGSVATLEFGAK
jgi:hypothetical protein